MQKHAKVTEQSWGKNSHSINNWLLERHKVLTAYCELVGINSGEPKSKALPKDIYVKHFCQILMDYVSAGHFEIFELIQNEYQRIASEHVKVVNELCPKIFISTDFALHFNDKYADEIHTEHLNEFDRNLSQLGEHLEKRFELEDKLISPARTIQH
jgi:regulator of sigma D